MHLLKNSILFGGLLSMLLMTGCAVWPYNEKHIIAVRPENGTNIVEKLVQSDTGWASWVLLKPCYAGPDVSKSPSKYTYFIEGKSGRRTKVECLTFLRKHGLKNDSYQDTLWRGYYDVRPVINTNLWLALHRYPSSYRRTVNDTNNWEYDRSFELYVFNNREIVHQRSWTAMPWRQDGTNVEFRIDPTNHRITYQTTQGYETYDVLRDTVTPSDMPH
jgi:hypothetical protein